MSVGVTGIEVKSGRRAPERPPGMEAFERAFAPDRTLLLGEGGIDLVTFLSSPASRFLA